MGHTFHLATEGALPLFIVGSASILLFVGAMGKSAQFPLHVWLPDAMEGPTPVSALIHAATMVAAGVYLVARSAPLFHAAAGTPVGLIVGIIAVITLLMAGAIGMAARDIKRVLAYSTISQLGYMMLGLAAGGAAASIFHLATHAFFKALLFLCAGSVIHAAHTQDLFEMGGLGKKMRITAATMGIGAISLIGIPPFAGFWSKDEILVEVFKVYPILGSLALLGVLMTSFYMTRLFVLAFIVPSRKESHAHESPSVMTIPLIILAVLSFIVGLWGSPWFGMQAQAFLGSGAHEVGEHGAAPSAALISLLSVGCGAFGMILGWAVYGASWIVPSKLFAPLRSLYVLATNKFYIDEMISYLILAPGRTLISLLSAFDQRVIDGFVNLVGFATNAFSGLNRLFDTLVVDGAVNGLAWITTETSRILRRTQTGFAQHYLLVLFVGVSVLVMSQIMK
jgi:NADH-quinone oxidoreductase subunit L